jgi:hypothetical protein
VSALVLGILLAAAALHADPADALAGPSFHPVPASMTPPGTHAGTRPLSGALLPAEPLAGEEPYPEGPPLETTPSGPGTFIPSDTESALERLTRLADAEAERLSAGGREGFTAQLALLCDPARVEPILDRFGAHPDLHVLPALHDGTPCFLVCWGRYPTAAGARAAEDLPAGMRSIQPVPLPKLLDRVLP